ncbi:MAG: hypothetical protein QM780_06595 [Hyphomicrobium sp.]|uniref:hypothetical protein n=1 Tax=Hyphomicrobium sp. TaxID=82 RepID=UPI0039E2C265
MTNRDPLNHRQSKPHPMLEEDPHWIEIFRERVSERLKQVFQEDMDWSTSLPILECLNRLHEAEAARSGPEEPDD